MAIMILAYKSLMETLT